METKSRESTWTRLRFYKWEGKQPAFLAVKANHFSLGEGRILEAGLEEWKVSY
jgi:hypothetical protein